MPWAQMSWADVPWGGTVRADVGITHPLLMELALTWCAHAGRLPGSAGVTVGRPRVDWGQGG